MSHTSIDFQLDLLEERFNTLAASLIDGRAEALQTASASLQTLAVELVQMLSAGNISQLGRSACSHRIRSLSVGLAVVRENLLRQSAYVDRALDLLVPATQQKATYAGSRTYGGSIRQSGAFTVLAA
jgi:hypothetical protein